MIISYHGFLGNQILYHWRTLGLLNKTIRKYFCESVYRYVCLSVCLPVSLSVCVVQLSVCLLPVSFLYNVIYYRIIKCSNKSRPIASSRPKIPSGTPYKPEVKEATLSFVYFQNRHFQSVPIFSFPSHPLYFCFLRIAPSFLKLANYYSQVFQHFNRDSRAVSEMTENIVT